MFKKMYIGLCLFAWSSLVISQKNISVLQRATNSSSTSLGNSLIKSDDGIKAPATNKVPDSNDETSLSQAEKKNVLYKILTGEWTDVSSDEDLPNEASVKVDLITGKKMAKIAKDSDNQGKKYIVSSKDELLSSDTLKHALKSLKKFKKDQNKNNENRKDYRDEKWTLEELKFERLKNGTVKDALQSLLLHYVKSDITHKLSILDEIEFLVHQYSVAHNFVKFGGVDVLLPDIKSENESLQGMIAMTFGAAMQGNSLVQLAVLKRGAMPLFLKLLRSNNSELQSRAMFALSALVRHHPIGQNIFDLYGGLQEMAQLFTENKTSEKVKRKVITLIYDLVLEQQTDEEKTQFLYSPLAIERASQRRKEFEVLLKRYGFCHHVTSLISSDDESVLEISIQAMSRLVYVCEREFFTIHDKLVTLQEKYKVKAYAELKEQQKKGILSDVPELYINNLYNSLTDVILVVNNCCKDEL